MSELFFDSRRKDDLDSLKDYEFTRQSAVKLNNVITSDLFQEKDSEAIYRYLQEQAQRIPFGTYLKRYIYENTETGEPFFQVPEEYYVSVIEESFAMNRAPHGFAPVSSRWRNIIKRWLRSASVKRTTVFLLGFGLKMTDRDVSVFLTKAIGEWDFRFDDPEEVIFWYCFHRGLPYSAACSLQNYYLHAGRKTAGKRAVLKGNNPDGIAAFWALAKDSLQVYLTSQKKLKEYLLYLKIQDDKAEDLIFEEFRKIYGRAVRSARVIIRQEKASEGRKRELTGAYDIESVLCSGTPRTGRRNLSPVTSSALRKPFANKRMSRQRLSRLLRGEAPVERFDLITLLFLVYAQEAESSEGEDAKERCLRFVDEMNSVLTRNGMMELYPANPYEGFVLLCLLADEPLSVYNDVWEMSYVNGRE